MRDSWVETVLGELAEITTGSRAKGGAITSGIPSIGGEQIAEDRSIKFNKMKFIPKDHFESMRTGKLKFGDSLLVKDGATTGKVGYWGYDIPAAVNEHVFILRAKPDCAEPYFINLLISHRPFREEIESRTRGIIGGITRDIENIGLVVPSLPEQKRIVDLISSVDSYIEALEKQLDSVRSASNAQLEKIVSAFSDDWREVTLGEVLEISRGGSPRPIQVYLTDSEDGINWIKIADATRSEKYIYSTLQKIKREGISRSREVFTGDFILSNSMSFGRPYIMRTDGCIHDGWLLLSKVSSYFDEDFLYNLLNSDYVQRQFESLAAGSGVRNLNIEVVKKVKVKIPKIEIQKELTSVINEFDNFIIKLTRQIHSGLELRKALLSNLLSGEHEIPASYDKVIGAA